MHTQYREQIKNEREEKESHDLKFKEVPNVEVHKDFHQMDSLGQLKANVQKLTELQFKLNFLIGEVCQLTSKNK
jgi:hypothetical protein